MQALAMEEHEEISVAIGVDALLQGLNRLLDELMDFFSLNG
jgi:hypothetical protein